MQTQALRVQQQSREIWLPPFTHQPGPGEDVVKLGTLEFITAVAFDLGLFLVVTSVLVVLIHNLARLVAGPDA